MQNNDKLFQLFQQALAWGCVYGPILSGAQWDKMRDQMANQYVDEYNTTKEEERSQLPR